MYLSVISTIFSILAILFGVASFYPGFYENNLLFGFFKGNMATAIFAIIVGLIALMCSMKYQADRMFFQVFGVIFGLIAIAGLVRDGDLWVTQINIAHNVLHFVIAVVFLVLGFTSDREGHV